VTFSSCEYPWGPCLSAFPPAKRSGTNCWFHACRPERLFNHGPRALAPQASYCTGSTLSIQPGNICAPLAGHLTRISRRYWAQTIQLDTNSQGNLARYLGRRTRLAGAFAQDDGWPIWVGCAVTRSRCGSREAGSPKTSCSSGPYRARRLLAHSACHGGVTSLDF
jgi:hypothetical protein